MTLPRILLLALLAGAGLAAPVLLGWYDDKRPSAEGWVLLAFFVMLPAAVLLWRLVVSVPLALRGAAWLDGTRLTVRTARTRTVDLATADTVSLRPIREYLAAPLPTAGWSWQNGQVPALVASGPGGTVRLRLASRERTLLPADQLDRLAEVMSASRAAGAAEVTGWLRETAAIR